MTNIFNIEIREFLPKIIDYFVKIHGEDYREIITKKLLNVDFNFYAHPNELDSLILNKKKEMLKTLAREFLNRLGLETTNSLISKFFNTCSTIEGTPMDEIYELLEQKELSPFQKNRSEYFFNMLLEQAKIEKGSKEETKIIELLNKNKMFFELMKEEEQNFKKSYEQAYKQIDETNRLKRRLTIAENLEFLLEFKDLLSKNDLILVNNALNGEELRINQLECKDILIGHSFEYKMAIDSFSTQNEENLRNGNAYLRKTVEESRIKYFKSKGIDLGNDYEAYEQSEECKKVRPSFELADKISKKREDLSKKILEECITKSREFQSIKEHTFKMNLEDTELFDEKLVREKCTYVSTNFVIENNTPKVKPVLYFCYTNLPDFLDVLLNHEINHALELEFLGIDGEDIHFQNGFEHIITRKGPQVNTENIKNKERREIELFNEVINHLIAEEVTKAMHDDGFYMLNNKDSARIYGATITTIANPLIKPFFEYYKKEILESRLTGNMEILFNTIGEENFYKLNESVKELFTLNRYTLMNDKTKNIKSETTEKYDEIRNNILKIYQNIKKYENAKNLS